MKAKPKLTHSFPAKAAGVFLLVVFAALAILSAAEIAFAYDSGYYFNAVTYEESAFYGNYLPEAEGLWLYTLTFTLRNWAIAVFIFSLFAFIADFIFLCCAAGHRGESEEAVLNQMDKIPLDLYVLAGGAVIALILNIAFGSFYGWAQAVVSVFAVILACLAALALFLSFVTRVKAGRWWANTIIYRLIRFLRRAVLTAWGWTFRTSGGALGMLPLVPKAALLSAGALALDFVLTALLCNGAGFFAGLLWFLFNLAVFAAVCFGALQMKKLKSAGEALSAGDFDYQLDTEKMVWEFKKHGDNLNSLARGMAIAVEQRMKSERLKTELITNVSHDIKTPLTSIINYVDLLQKKHTDEEETEYLNVLSRQSQRLKKLTEDLVEASKASTGNLSVTLVPTNTAEIVNQSAGEYEERLAAGNLSLVVSLPEMAPSVMADGRLLWRVMDNLLNNVCKYALPGTRVYLDVKQENGQALIEVKNISRAALNLSADELMERFVRGDASRNTEGSGLGLAIARSLTQLQKGTFVLSTDGDLFKAEIRLPLA